MDPKHARYVLHREPCSIKQKKWHEPHEIQKEDSVDLRDWMSRIHNDIPVSAITIPGTHDSAAHGSLIPFVTTQNLTIEEQLQVGIRYFDLRLGLVNDVLQMVHGRSTLGQTFDSILESMYTFLEKHPTEGLLAQIKRDRVDSNSTLCFSDAIKRAVGDNPDKWRTGPITPKMEQLRGRIQLLRRYRVNCASDDLAAPSNLGVDGNYDPIDTGSHGIDVSKWKNNPLDPFLLTTTHGTEVMIQDHYTPKTPTSFPALINCKGGAVSHMLRLARSHHARDVDQIHPHDIKSGEERQNRRNRWFINFTSAFEINFLYQYTPDQIALGTHWDLRGRWCVGINSRLLTWLEANTDRAVRQYRRHRRLERIGKSGIATIHGDVPDIEKSCPAPEVHRVTEGINGEHAKNHDDDTYSQDYKGLAYGVIIMDFPDTVPSSSAPNALLKAIVHTNFCLKDIDDNNDDDNDDDDDRGTPCSGLRRTRAMIRTTGSRKYLSFVVCAFLGLMYLLSLGSRGPLATFEVRRW